MSTQKMSSVLKTMNKQSNDKVSYSENVNVRENINDVDIDDIDYIKSVCERNMPKEVEEEQDDLTVDDPDCVLPYWRITPEVVRKFRDRKLSANGQIAFHYIVLNASNIREGISRPINLQGLSDFLGVQKARVYKLIAELESKEFIVPRDKQSRWTYIIPDACESESAIKDYHKSKVAKKKAAIIEDKIYAIAKIFKVKFGVDNDFGFRSVEQREMVNILTECKTIKDILRRLEHVIKKPISTEQKEFVRQALTDIEKQYNRIR